MLISSRSVSDVYVSSDVEGDEGISSVFGMVAITGLNKKVITLYK